MLTEPPFPCLGCSGHSEAEQDGYLATEILQILVNDRDSDRNSSTSSVL